MCGIAGFNWENKTLIKKMTDSLIHRGPDDYGYFLDKNISLGHRRLSIIDLSKNGKQPMSNEDSSMWITYNGEIFNFKEIRENLEKKGHRFKSDTDTEVILHLYEEYKEDCLRFLNGQFAFAIYDSKKQQLFLARDRLGIKQLYYYWDNKKFIFASEMKAILQADIKREINKEVISDFFSCLNIPAPKTILKNIYKLLPGHCLILKNNELRGKKYWDIHYKEANISKKQAEKLIIKNLKEAVKKRLIADVPLGAFLSGGIDSSTIVALMSKLTDKVKTFSIGFEGNENDELPLARKTAKMYNTDHHELIIKPAEFSLFPKLVYHADEPFADSSLIPTYLVSQAARKKVKVILSGDGGDENFAGYDKYPKSIIESYYAKLPKRLRKSIYGLIRNKRLKRITRIGLIDDNVERFIKGNQRFLDFEKKQLFNFQIKQKMPEIEKNISILNKMLYYDIKNTLPNLYLKKIDTASMANSLEVRTPFLDHKFMEFASVLPSKYKLNFLTKKYILKRAIKNLVPEQVIKAKKRGFSIPVNEWLKGELKGQLKEIIVSTIKRGCFNKSYLEKLWSQHQKDICNHQERLWAFISFELWNRIYIDNINYSKVL